MRTGNDSTNDYTGKRYEMVFHSEQMKKEKRIISHGRQEKNKSKVLDIKGNQFTIPEALEKKIDWVQIDVDFLTESDKQLVLDLCQ